ncbi:hypothetical protein [uncultured Microscilla sp.]|uniref:hypothetical protein n=1 Tax=uncultured Microscilla sp. TaxID=432653 RepID=UPI002611F6FA|nr:hypothetical protein [uncultured Microscilla sp.]
MNKKTIILAILIVGATVVYFKSNFSRTKGKAVITYFNKTQRLNQLNVWGPYGYYLVDWTVNVYDGKPNISGKGRSQFRSFGKSSSRNNYYHRNQLPLEAVNQSLQSMEKEQAYLIRVSDYKKQKEPSQTFLIITKDPALYNNNKKMLELAKIAIRPNTKTNGSLKN